MTDHPTPTNSQPADSQTANSQPANAQDRVRQFHAIFGLPILAAPGTDPSRFELRLDLIREELEELTNACAVDDLTEICDALGDLLYVVYGFGAEIGVDLEAVVTEIHRSNMTKLWDSGAAEHALAHASDYPPERRPAAVVHLDDGSAVVYRADGKVLKGPDWSAPDFRSLLSPDITLPTTHTDAVAADVG